jgi:hypothetical protein
LLSGLLFAQDMRETIRAAWETCRIGSLRDEVAGLSEEELQAVGWPGHS